MAQRATSLGPKPSLFIVCFLFVFFVFFCFPLPFLYLLFNRKTLFSPLKKAIFVYLSVFPFVSLLPCLGLPLFSLSLSLSLSCYFLSSFLPVFSSLFLVLSFYFCLVCFLVQDVMLFFFFCLLSSFVLNHHV